MDTATLPLPTAVATTGPARSHAEAEQLFLRHRGLVGFAIRRLPTKVSRLGRDEAEQVALIGLWRACQSWRPECCALSTWAVMCINRRLWRATRGPRIRLTLFGALCDPDDEDRPFEPEAPDDSGQERADARITAADLLRTLDSRSRRIVCLRYGIGGEELSAAEVAAEMGLSVKRVHQLEGRALHRLRQRHARQPLSA